MAKRKSVKQPERPEKPAAPETLGGGAPDPALLRTPPIWRDFILALLVILGTGATIFIWLHETPATRSGLIQTGVVWAVALAGLFGRVQARRSVCRLEALLSHKEVVTARLRPDITEEESGLKLRHVSGWLVAVLGLAATAVLWQIDIIERVTSGAVMSGLSTLIVGATVSTMLALAVAANSINRVKTRRLSRDFRAALSSERLALDTLRSLDVMISACLPTGERTRFNEDFLKYVGKNAAQMQGHGWLEIVHPEDRQAALEMVGKPASNARAREHDICVRHKDGEYKWLHETLVPRFSDKGELIEFICTAIDITRRVENEAALDKQIGDLKIDLGKAQIELNAAKAELTEAKSELSKAKTSRSRLEASLDETRAEAKKFQESLSEAHASISQVQCDAVDRIKEMKAEAAERVKAAETSAESRVAKAESEARMRVRKIEESAESRVAKFEEAVKSAKQEHQQAALENKKVANAFEKLKDEMGLLRLENGDLREQVARHIKETREAKTQAAEAEKSESQHRAKSDRLTQRCEELGTQVAAKQAALTAALNQAELAGVAASAEVERRVHEASAKALATHLRTQLDGMQRMTDELLAQSLDGPAKDAAHNAAATVRSMSELVDQALGRKPAPSAAKAAPAKSFDLKRTAEGVREMLNGEAQARDVKLSVETAANLRPVHGDDVEIRTALASLTRAALELVTDGTLVLRLSEDVATGAHSTVRCELSHDSARVKNNALEAALAIKSSDKDMPDAAKQPVAHQAAKAWRSLRALDCQHGFLLPAEGGFSVWFTFTLSRPAASAALRTSSPVPPVPARTTPPVAPAKPAASTKAPVLAAHNVLTTPFEPGPDAAQPAMLSESMPESSATKQLPRMPTENLSCNLGEVVEMGADTMRVFAAKPPKEKQVVIELETEGMTELNAEVVWCKKMEDKRHDVGLKLPGLSPEQRQKIIRIGMQHRKATTTLGND